ALRDAAQRAPGAPTFATSAELGASTAAAVDAAQKGTTLHQLLGAWAKTSGSRPAPARIVEQRRRASGFEALRDASDAYHNQFGHRPAVVLAKLGPVAEHTARATYAKNFFEAGGIEAIDADPVATPADAEQLAKNYSQATFVVLCGADERYRAEGVVFAAALREWTRTYLAGRPSEQESELRQAGIDEFIHIGVDVLACLQNAHRLLKAGEAS
ncbi:MAG: methylmalonyl-CoA mutase, partial [Myxococcota bacterium]